MVREAAYRDVYKRQPNVNIVMPQEASNRVLFAGEHLKKALEDAGYSSGFSL